MAYNRRARRYISRHFTRFGALWRRCRDYPERFWPTCLYSEAALLLEPLVYRARANAITALLGADASTYTLLKTYESSTIRKVLHPWPKPPLPPLCIDIIHRTSDLYENGSHQRTLQYLIGDLTFYELLPEPKLLEDLERRVKYQWKAKSPSTAT